MSAVPAEAGTKSTCEAASPTAGAPGADRMYYGEKFNAISHLLGAVLALAGAVVLVVLAAGNVASYEVSKRLFRTREF